MVSCNACAFIAAEVMKSERGEECDLVADGGCNHFYLDSGVIWVGRHPHIDAWAVDVLLRANAEGTLGEGAAGDRVFYLDPDVEN